MQKAIEIDLDKLREWYLDDNLSAQQIADKVGCTPRPILDRLRTLGIVRPRGNQPNSIHVKVGSDELKQLYCIQKMSLPECAGVFSCSTSTIQRRLDDLKIWERKDNKIVSIPMKELIDLYCNKGMNMKQCAEHFGISRGPIRKRLLANNIELKTDIYKNEKNGNWKGGLVKRICQMCGIEFNFRKDQLKRKNRGKYCSRECSDLGHQTKVKKMCVVCNKEFYAKGAEDKIGRANCCSVECRSKFYRGSNNSLWKGGGKEKHEFVCDHCHNTFLSLNRPRSVHRFCSGECQSSYFSGNQHWNWKGGWKEHKKRMKIKLRGNPKRKLQIAMCAAVRRSLIAGRGTTAKWTDWVGYDVKKLYRHLNKTMPPGYDWMDFTHGRLHIDHRIPVSAFAFETPYDIDFRHCWALKNLRLLPAFENLSKGAKLDRPFQPSLKLAINNR